MVLPRADGKARRQLGKLQDEVRHMHWILADALHFLQAAPLCPQLLDLTEVVSKNLLDWDSLQLDLDPELPLARLDLEQMEHLIRNTLTFFRRISAPGRSVRLRTYSAEGEVVLSISSDSLEFTPEDLEPLFDPFEGSFPAGSGLALASARKIAEAHGARLRVVPEPPRSLALTIAFAAA
ncbi:MAG: sensor histidine kinase [Acidobacteriota bacterium]